jgi:hypothetical protein
LRISLPLDVIDPQRCRNCMMNQSSRFKGVGVWKALLAERKTLMEFHLRSLKKT